MVVAPIGILAAVALPACQTCLIKAKMSDVLLAMSPCDSGNPPKTCSCGPGDTRMPVKDLPGSCQTPR